MEKTIEQIKKEKAELEETIVSVIKKFISENSDLEINIDAGIRRINGYNNKNVLSEPFAKVEI